MAKKKKPKGPQPAAPAEPEKTKTPEPVSAADDEGTGGNGSASEPVQEAAESITERLKRQATDDADRADDNVRERMSVIKREQRRVPVKLTDMAIAKAAKMAADQFKVLQDKRETAKKEMSLIRKGVQEAEVEHAKLMSALDTGIGEELVTCEDRMDWDNKLVISVRLDLPEDDANFIMERRTMTEAELQYPLKLDPIQDPTKLEAATALKKVNELAEAEKLKYHRDGKICRKETCKRPHLIPELLQKAGVEIETPAAAPASDVTTETETAPDDSRWLLTEGQVEQIVNGDEFFTPTGDAAENGVTPVEGSFDVRDESDPDDWRRKDPKMLRGRHLAPPFGDGAYCFKPADECELSHSQPEDNSGDGASA